MVDLFSTLNIASISEEINKLGLLLILFISFSGGGINVK